MTIGFDNVVSLFPLYIFQRYLHRHLYLSILHMHARWLGHGLPCKRDLATAWAISRSEAFWRRSNVSKVQYKLHFSILLATTLASRSSPSPHSVPAAASACRDRRVTHTHTHTLPVFLLSRTSKIASDSLRPASSYFVPLQSSIT